MVHTPLYNGLILLMDVIPWVDAGIAVILFTIIVKLALFPLSRKAVQTQIMMKTIEPTLQEIKEKYKDDKVEQARATMALYKEKGINPLISVVLLFIQLPIIFALYRIFWSSGLPQVNTNLLYSFVAVPASINMVFLGLIDISTKSIPLAILVGISTYLQARFMSPIVAPLKDGEKPSFKHDLQKSMHLQMRYVFPVFTALIAYNISVAISLYWITSNVFTIGQELYLRKKLAK